MKAKEVKELLAVLDSFKIESRQIKNCALSSRSCYLKTKGGAMTNDRELCAGALSAIDFAKKENLERTAKYIEWECVKYDFSYEAIIRRVFVSEVGERFVGKNADERTKIDAGKETAAEILIKIGNPKWIYWFAKYITGISQDALNELTVIIINTGDSCLISSFASDAHGLSKDNINDLASAVLRINNAGSTMRFAKYVKSITLELKNQLAEIVLASKDPMWAYFFAEGVVGISNSMVERFAKIVIESKNSRYAYLFAKFITVRLSQEILQQLIETVKSGRDEDLDYFGNRTVIDLNEELNAQFLGFIYTHNE